MPGLAAASEIVLGQGDLPLYVLARRVKALLDSRP